MDAVLDYGLVVVGVAAIVAWTWASMLRNYPVIPTLAWLVPVCAALLFSAFVDQPARTILSLVALAAWLGMWWYEPLRRFWHRSVFRWK
jgi:hypothetical protein